MGCMSSICYLRVRRSHTEPHKISIFYVKLTQNLNELFDKQVKCVKFNTNFPTV